MVGLGLIIRLPYQLIAAIGIAIALLHNTLDPIHAASFGNYSDMWLLIHEQGILTIHNQPIAFVMYPALAWFGIICLGYSFGPIFTSAPELRQRIALRLSGVFAVVFCALRAFHLYGDHVQFEALQTPAQSAMSFMNVTKYPPSLDYMLATFSVVLAIYVVFDLASNRDWLAKARGVVETYGRVPFFYYVQHLYLLHITALLVGLVIGIRDPKPLNFSLGGVYLVWIAIVATLYWPCLWFSKLKARRRDWWLSYL